MVEQSLSATDDLDLLCEVMPPHIRDTLVAHDQRQTLLEVVLDLGRQPEARFPDHIEELSSDQISREDLEYVVTRVGRFGKDNRAGIERTLHRISAIRNRVGTVIGLTCRVGRALFGTVDILRDVIERGNSLLLLGRPGVGKTTLLREAARVLADDVGKRVVVVDTSNEIAGDGDIPHPGIGHARRMQVPSPSEQHDVMIEAVENHMPEVIVIDEIGTEAESLAARTIAERGVQLIATAHGNTLDNLLRNPTLADLVGGIQAVTLSDEEARRRRTQKTVLERKAPPTFDVLIEIQERDRLAVYHQVARMVDDFLRGMPLEPELRIRAADGSIEVRQAMAPSPPPSEYDQAELPFALTPRRRKRRKTLRIFPFAVNRSRLDRAIRSCQVPAHIVNNLDEANLILTLKSHQKHRSKRLADAQERGVPLYALRNNTVTQMINFLQTVYHQEGRATDEEAAMHEAEAAMLEVVEQQHPVALSPQNTYVRRLQHRLAERHGLLTQSTGAEPHRRVVVYPL